MGIHKCGRRYACSQNIKDVEKILIMNYSGMRAKEFLSVEIKNSTKKSYLLGGMKTVAGKDTRYTFATLANTNNPNQLYCVYYAEIRPRFYK